MVTPAGDPSSMGSLMQEGPGFDNRPFIEVLQQEQLPPQLQDTIVHALAFADAAQLSSSHTQPEPAQARHQQTVQHVADSTANSAATSGQQPDIAHASSSSIDPGGDATQHSPYPGAGRRSTEASSDNRQSPGEHADDTAGSLARQNRAREQCTQSRRLMSHAQGMAALAQYMKSAGRSVIILWVAQ